MKHKDSRTGLDRRELMKAAVAGAGALALPGTCLLYTSDAADE